MTKTPPAELHTVQHVFEGENPMYVPVYKGVNPGQAKIAVDFGDSPLSCEWNRRITDEVKSMPVVFTQHDMDYGHTVNVKHLTPYRGVQTWSWRATVLQGLANETHLNKLIKV